MYLLVTFHTFQIHVHFHYCTLKRGEMLKFEHFWTLGKKISMQKCWKFKHFRTPKFLFCTLNPLVPRVGRFHYPAKKKIYRRQNCHYTVSAIPPPSTIPPLFSRQDKVSRHAKDSTMPPKKIYRCVLKISVFLNPLRNKLNKN